MKVFGNATAFVVAVCLMGGLILAQRDYQNSWHQQSVIQMSASPAAPASVGHYSVVMK
jgi:hypothetical protein